MSSLTLLKSALKSRKIREALVGPDDKKKGIMLIDLRNQIEVKGEDGKKNIFQRIWDFVAGGSSWLLGSVAGLGKKILGGIASAGGNIWQWATNAVIQLAYFDWNQSDAQIDARLKAAWESVANSVGETTCYLIGGGINIAASLLIPKIGPAVAKYALGEFTEEAWGEFKSSFRIILQTLGQTALLTLFKGARWSIKQLASQFNLSGKWKGALNSWGDGKKPFIIYQRVEEWIEKSFDGLLEKFLAGVWEGLFDGFQEAGTMVGQGIDVTIAAMRAKSQDALGPDRALEVELYSREGKDTEEGAKPQSGKLILQGPQELLQPTLYSAMATHQILDDRDLGQLLGSQVTEQEWNPKLQLRQLKITYSSRDRPPLWIEPRPRPKNYQTTGNGTAKQPRERARRSEITIPDVKPGLTWKEIKEAAGTYTRGNWLVSVMLDSGREMQVWAADAPEGQRLLLRLAALSTADPLTGTLRAEQVLDLEPARKKPLDKMHGAHFVILWRKPKTGGDGKISWDGKVYSEQIKKIPIWPESPLEPYLPAM